MNFKIGDRVRCIDATFDVSLDIKTLKQDAEYIVQDIILCTCGTVRLDVGAVVYGKLLYGACYCCDKILTQVGEVADCFNSKRFVKVQERYKAVTIQVEKEEPILS